jgi:hypothetical protein
MANENAELEAKAREWQADNRAKFLTGETVSIKIGKRYVKVPYLNEPAMMSAFAASLQPAPTTVSLCKHCHLKIYFRTGRNPKWRHHASNFVECFGDLETWAEPTSEYLASVLANAAASPRTGPGPVCPNCGSGDLDFISFRHIRCKSCKLEKYCSTPHVLSEFFPAPSADPGLPGRIAKAVMERFYERRKESGRDIWESEVEVVIARELRGGTSKEKP